MSSHDVDPATTHDRRGGLLGLVTLPFRAVGAVAGIGMRLVAFVTLLAGVPVRLALGTVRAVVNLASDLVYALWRAVMVVVRAVLGAFGLLIGAVMALVGLVRRLVMVLVGAVFTLLGLVLTLVKVALTVVAIPIAAVVGVTITIARAVLAVVRAVLKVLIGVLLLPLRPFGIGRRSPAVERVVVDDPADALRVPDAA